MPRYQRDSLDADCIIVHKYRYWPTAEIIGRHAQSNGSPDNLSCQLIQIKELPRQDLDEVYQQLTELPFPPELSEDMHIDGYRFIREVSSSNHSQPQTVSWRLSAFN